MKFSRKLILACRHVHVHVICLSFSLFPVVFFESNRISTMPAPSQDEIYFSKFHNAHFKKLSTRTFFSRSIDTWNLLALFDSHCYQSGVFITSKKSRQMDFIRSESGVNRCRAACNCTIQFALCKCKRWLECLHWISELSCLLPPVYSQISQETFWRISLEKKN